MGNEFRAPIEDWVVDRLDGINLKCKPISNESEVKSAVAKGSGILVKYAGISLSKNQPAGVPFKRRYDVDFVVFAIFSCFKSDGANRTSISMYSTLNNMVKRLIGNVPTECDSRVELISETPFSDDEKRSIYVQEYRTTAIIVQSV